MNKPTLVIAMIAAATIETRRIVKFKDDDDGRCLTAAAAGDGMFGITSDLQAKKGEPVDIVVAGIANVEYGDTVEAGKLLTSDATGRAVHAADAGNRTIGVARENGVVGAIGSVLVSQSQIK